MSTAPCPALAANETIGHALDRAVQLVGESKWPQAVEVYRAVLQRDSENDFALSNIGPALFQSGKFSEGLRYLKMVNDLQPDNEDVRNNLLNACKLLIRQRILIGDYVGAIEPLRILSAVEPDDPKTTVNLVQCLFFANQPACLDDFASELDLDKIGTKILIACMQKSGSTWLHNTIVSLTDFESAPFAYAYLQNEQELYLPNVIATAERNTVTQQHCRATAANVQMLQGFGIRPIVLVRNLFDILVSLTEFYVNGAVINTFYYKDFASFDRATQLDLVIDNWASWYVQFFASWAIAEDEERLATLRLTYEDMMSDKPGAIGRVMAYYGIDKSAAEIEAAIAKVDGDKAKTRFNKGVAGRGEAELTDDQKSRIRRMAGYYPTIDFGAIGL